MAGASVDRELVWGGLREVARPDSRFHLRFADFIPDFEGSTAGTDRLLALPAFAAAKHAFVAPDNSLITGTGAINEAGVRFGKGHGFFDAEWGMLYRIGKITTRTPTAAVVHDCQVLTETLYPEVFDTVADAIFTPTRTIEVAGPHKPTCGIVWNLLDPHMLATIPPLQELQAMEPALPPLAAG